MAEARSWPGYSGSPAFALMAIDRNPGFLEFTNLPTPIKDIMPLLGVVSGFWELPEEMIHRRAPRHSDDPLINVGISMIVPGQHILDLLNREDVVEDRQRLVRRGLT